MPEMLDFFRTMRDLHPSERAMADIQATEDKLHGVECDAWAEDESYVFADATGQKWRERLCWCGRGMNYEKVEDNAIEV